MNSRFPPRSGVALLSSALCCLPVMAAAQSGQPQAGPPANSLIVDPQQGATPRPIAPAPTPATPNYTPPASPAPAPAPVMRAGPGITLQPLRGTLPDSDGDGALVPLPGVRGDGFAGAPPGDPFAVDPATDPILKLARPSESAADFRAAIQAVVQRNPSRAEAVAQQDEAVGARNEARAVQYPVVDLSLSHFEVLDREFSNDPQNVLERSRPAKRTDGIVRIQQPLIDFGSTRDRISAGNRRIEAATAGIDSTNTEIAMRGISAWYQVFGYRALVALCRSFVDGQVALKGAIQERVKQGYSAPGDLAQVESYIAAAQAQLAGYQRQLASAEAQYEGVTGLAPPATLGRAPAAELPPVSQDRARQDAETIPSVRAAKMAAEAARFDAKATRANALPSVSASVDAGRYGVFETAKDYDIRGTVTLSQRLGGGATQRMDQSAARARGAEARYQEARTNAIRDAAIAWSDVQAIEASEAAIRDNYLATRQSRDVLAERFRVSRGTLFDLLGAEANYFNVAARYIETVTELDIARYALLARRGKLLDAFNVEPAQLDRK